MKNKKILTPIEIEQNSFFREVSDEIQSEKISLIWKKYKYYIIAIIVSILTYTISKNYYNSYKIETSLKEARLFEKVFSNPTVSNDGKILELKELGQKLKFGYKEISLLNIYSLQMEEKKYEDAKKTLQDIINTSKNKTFKNIAIIKFASLRSILKFKETDRITTYTYLNMIKQSEPFYNTAQFIIGSMNIEENKFNEAKTIFEKLVKLDSFNPIIPNSIRSEAQTMLNFINSNLAK